MLKLGEKTEVVFVVQSYVIDSIFEHGYSFYTKTKGKAGIDFRIISNHSKYFWINHSSANNFEPPRTFTYTTTLALADYTGDIHLGARLGKGKKLGRNLSGRSPSKIFWVKTVRMPFKSAKETSVSTRNPST